MMNNKFLDFYHSLTGKTESDITKIKDKRLLSHIVDLILMEKGVNNRVLKLGDKLMWINPKSRVIGHMYFNLINKHDPFITEKKTEQYTVSVFYNKKLFPESEVKTILTRYWKQARMGIEKKIWNSDLEILNLIGQKFGYFTPTPSLSDKKYNSNHLHLIVLFGIQGSDLEFYKDDGETLYIYENSKNPLISIYKMIQDTNKILNKLKPKFYVKSVDLIPPKCKKC